MLIKSEECSTSHSWSQNCTNIQLLDIS